MKSDFPSLLKRLNDCEVDYILVGGMAAAFHGSNLSNLDCDVVVDMRTENLIRLAGVLSDFSPSFRVKFPEQAFDLSVVKNGAWDLIELNTDAGAFDCHCQIKGLGDFTECKERSLEADLGAFSILVLTREALITAKKAMGRPKDLQTVAQLEIGRELDA
jgi:hypothetical protein